MNQSQRSVKWQRKAVAVAVASCFAVASPVYANPIGANVVSGVVSMAQQGGTLNITNTPGAIINWQSFSIGANEATRFLQQSASSSVLNRVMGQDPSSILGALQSNGRVFLINPNGVLFGAGAQVDVAGLVVSTLNLSNADFLAGRYNFTASAGAGGIDNQGSLTALPGGQIYLVAPDIKNSGIITSPQGDVILAAGNSVELVNANTPDMRVVIDAPSNQVLNLGSIVANSGRVGIYAGLINHHGIVSADTASVGATGKITFHATKDINLEAGSVISASGAPGGVHDGGEVRIVADGKLNMRQGSQVRVDGGLDGGNGGFLELSGKHVLLNGDMSIRAHAPGFRGGRLFIDPSDFTVSSSCGGSSCMTPAAINAALSGSVTVDIQANHNITVANAVTGSGSGGSLLMRAGNDIHINAYIGASTGARFNHALTMVAGNDINIRANIYQGNYPLILRAAATAADLGFTPFTGAPTTGMVNIGPDTNVNNSSVTVDTQGSVWISGKGLNVAGNGYYNGPSVESYGNGYAAALYAAGNIIIGSKTGDANSRPMTGGVTIQGGYLNNTSGDASATVTAGGDIDINISGQLAVRGGTLHASNMSSNSADVHAKLHAGNNLTVQASSIEVKGGTFNMASNSSGNRSNTFDASALLGAGMAVSLTATGAIEVLGGTIDVTGNTYYVSSNNVNATALIEGGSVTVNAGSLKVQGGTISVTGNSSSGQYNILDVSAKIAATAFSGNLDITTSSEVQVRGGEVTASSNFRGNSFYTKAALEALSGAVTITAGSLTVAGGSATLSGSPASNYLYLNALVQAGNITTLTTAGDINVTGGTVNGASAGNTIYANATIGAAQEVLATVGGTTGITINAGTITGSDTAYADARIESAIPNTIRVSFTNLTSGGYSVNGIPGAITDGNSGFFTNGTDAILDSTIFFQYAAAATTLTPPVQMAANTTDDGLNRTTDFGLFTTGEAGSSSVENGSDDTLKKKAYTCQ